MVAVIQHSGHQSRRTVMSLRPAQTTSEYMSFWTMGDAASTKTNKQKTLKEFIVKFKFPQGGRKGVLFYKW